MRRSEVTENVPLFLRIPVELKERMRKKALKKGTTVSALGRDILEHYLKDDPKKAAWS